MKIVQMAMDGWILEHLMEMKQIGDPEKETDPLTCVVESYEPTRGVFLFSKGRRIKVDSKSLFNNEVVKQLIGKNIREFLDYVIQMPQDVGMTWHNDFYCPEILDPLVKKEKLS